MVETMNKTKKILQINQVYYEKSTGRTCYELSEFANGRDDCCFEVFTAYGRGKKNKDYHLYRIGNNISYYLHNLLSRLTGLEGFFSFFSTKRLIRWIKQIKPDIIHLRNLHGHYLNLNILFNFLKTFEKPIIFSLHDFWMFTGHCPYPILNNCKKNETICCRCPSLRTYPKSWFFDTSKIIFKKKKEWVSSLKRIYILGVSKWTIETISKTYVFSKAIKTKYVYNWVDLNVYNNCPLLPSPYTNNIFNSKKIVLVCSANWEEKSQKFSDFLYMVKHLSNICSFAVVGKVDFNVDKYSDLPIKFYGFVKDKLNLAPFYCYADVYAHLSRGDTFGKVIAESMSCGTPIVAFNTTALTELVTNNVGVLIDNYDLEAFANAIENVCVNKNKFSKECLKRAKSLFDMNNNIEQLIQFYDEILNN